MNKYTARLYGVVNPTGLDEGFCVPVFVDEERSNNLLVQIVNERNHIEAFEPFFSSIDVEPIDLYLTKRVGDPAFWYFELHNGPIFGTIDDIKIQFQNQDHGAQGDPLIELQIVAACQIEGRESTVHAARDVLSNILGEMGATAWLDTNVITPKLRDWLNLQFRDGHSRETQILLSQVLAVTSNNVTFVLAPRELAVRLKEGALDHVTTLLKSLLKIYNLSLGELAFLGDSGLEGLSPVNVQRLKNEAVLSFGRTKGTSFRQDTKSYFEADSGSLRVVCTFSSRYEGKGKRKYWFGYHKTWDLWLEGAKDGFVILGCIDTRTCFALPLSFIRAQLPHLRTSGTGRDLYWHIDIVDLHLKKNLLDLPRLRQSISLEGFAVSF